MYRVRVKMVRMKGTRAQQERSEGMIMVDEEWPMSWRTSSALHGNRVHRLERPRGPLGALCSRVYSVELRSPPCLAELFHQKRRRVLVEKTVRLGVLS